MAKEQVVRKKKKRRKKHYLLRLFLFFALIAGLFYFANSPFFDVDEIAVENNVYYTAEQVIDRAGLKTGENIFFDIKTVEGKEMLMKDAYIKNAKISRKFPNKIAITVEERAEAAAIPYASSYILIDADGLVLRMSEVEPKLPLLVGLTVKNMETGKALEVEENAILNDTLLMTRAVAESDIYFKKIDISKVMVKAYVYDQLICQGMPYDIRARAEDGTLQSILYELYAKGIERGTLTVTADAGNMAFSPDYE